MFKGSWKTSLAGWLVVLGAIASAGIAILDNDPKTVFDIQQIMAAFAGVGLIAARDNDKTSTDVGADKK